MSTKIASSLVQFHQKIAQWINYTEVDTSNPAVSLISKVEDEPYVMFKPLLVTSPFDGYGPW